MSVETFTDLPAFQRKVTELTSSESLWCASLASMLCENTICNKWEGHFRGYSVAVASGNAILEDPASKLGAWSQTGGDANHNQTVSLLRPRPWTYQTVTPGLWSRSAQIPQHVEFRCVHTLLKSSGLIREDEDWTSPALCTQCVCSGLCVFGLHC